LDCRLSFTLKSRTRMGDLPLRSRRMRTLWARSPRLSRWNPGAHRPAP
jgi:hypothetical protein